MQRDGAPTGRRRLADASRTATGSRPCKVIAVLGSRGGVGCTTLAVNLAATWPPTRTTPSPWSISTWPSATADVALDMIPDHTIADLALNIDKLDLNYMRRSLLQHEPTNLQLLAHPLQMTDVTVIQPAHVERMLNLLKINYTHLVLDLRKGLTPTDLVGPATWPTSSCWSPSWNCPACGTWSGMMMTLGEQEGIAEKVRVVINRVGARLHARARSA